MWRSEGGYGGSEDGAGLWGVLFNNPGLIAVLALIVLVVVLIAGVLAAVAVRRLRRNGTIGRGMLQLKAQGLPPGPARELAGLRLSLNQAADYTASCVGLAVQAGRPMGDVQSLTRRLTAVSSALDRELALLEREPDPVRLRSVLPAARERVQAATAAGARIRDSLGQLDAAEGSTELAALTADIATEVTALQAGVDSLRGLGEARG